MRLVTDPAHVSTALHPEALAPAATAVVLYRPGAADAFLLPRTCRRPPTGRSTSCGGPMRPACTPSARSATTASVRSWPRSGSTSPMGPRRW